MKTISKKKLFSIDMLSADGWKRVREECAGITTRSSDERLGEGWVFFMQIWADDNGYGFDPCQPDSITKRGQYFFCDISDEKLFFAGDLEKVLLDRWCDYLQGD